MGRRHGRIASFTAPGGAALSRLLLDTTFLIDAERAGTSAHDAIADDDEVAVAAVTIAELVAGVHLAEAKWRAARRRFVSRILDEVPVLPYDLAVAAAHGDLLAATRRSGRPRGAHDLIIAATARAAHRIVVTADPGAFAGLPGVTCRCHR